MTGDFDCMLRGKRPRGSQNRQEDFVDEFIAREDSTVVHGMRRGVRRSFRMGTERMEASIGNAKSVRAGQTEDRQTAFTNGGGDGDNGVGEIHGRKSGKPQKTGSELFNRREHIDRKERIGEPWTNGAETFDAVTARGK